MPIPPIIWIIFLFALGSSVGSFINVVVYRLPREMSIVRPGSHCTLCEHPIAWYDNVPIIAWFLLRGRCRHCGGSFSIRYPMVELLTALLFVMLYWAYFLGEVREGLTDLSYGRWLIYIGHMVLICGLLVSSLIDGEHWIIPLSVSYTVVGAALILSMIWPYFVAAAAEPLLNPAPWASIKTGALALGGAAGLGLSMILLKFGLIKRSFADYDQEQEQPQGEKKHAPPNARAEQGVKGEEIGIDLPPNIIRREMFREVIFLLPVVAGAVVLMSVLTSGGSPASGWGRLILGQKWLCGLLGSVFGFMIGGGVVWATRIGGSLAFGKEAMGLGDVHLMAAVGAMLGWTSPVIAFFLAPFMGLSWALARLLIHRTREIPYGPFLSMATVIVMLAHDIIVQWFIESFTLGPATVGI